MNKQIGYFFVCINFLLFNLTFSQEVLTSEGKTAVPNLFLNDSPLPLKLSFSIKNLKKNTNDSTYINSEVFYEEDGEWKKLGIDLRARGKYRLKNCYFPPLKIKIKKGESKNTLFDSNRNLKVVIPCLLEKDNDDNVIKEFLAYKLFEIISPYHFKTRLVDLTLEEERGNKVKQHNLKGFLIEDDKKVAERFKAKLNKREVHPLNYEANGSVRHAIFQYMIGNTDYSVMYFHNTKALFVDKNLISVPYDFDMSGFVNCSYAIVSDIPGEKNKMTSVKQRKYRGFVRNESTFYEVRKEFISKKIEMLTVLDNHSTFFENEKEFTTAREYLLSFFSDLENDKKFRENIIEQSRKE